MKFYHGTDNPNLTELKTDFTNEGYVFLTKSYEFALLYGGCTCRFWNYNKETNKLIFREVCEDGLIKMYKGKTCYIYTTEEIDDVEEYEYLGAKNYKTKQDVNLQKKEVVQDVYDKIMELYKAGKIEIWFWKDYTEVRKQKVYNGAKEKLCEDMKLCYKKYRKDYDVLTKLFPETALSNQEIKAIELSTLK